MAMTIAPTLHTLKPLKLAKSHEVKLHEWRGTAMPSVWDVKGGDLERVPLNFPLERTHRKIGEKASVVAKRISKSLLELSVEAYYDSNPPRAKCRTSDYVEFRIHLYSGRENGDQVVVELQRRSGSSPSFIHTCRQILNAAEGKTQDKNALKARSMPPFMVVPISQMKCLQSAIPKLDHPDVEATSCFVRAIDMFRSNRPDLNVLGLEDLCVLTDPVKTSPAVAIRVSKHILLGSEKNLIRDEIRLLTDPGDVPPETLVNDEVSSKHSEKLHHLALCVFANAVNMCFEDSCLGGAVEEQKWFSDNLIPCLVRNINLASKSASNAYHAARCLQCLISSSNVVRQLLASNIGVGTLKRAQEFGEARHELLADEAQQCLSALNNHPVFT